jgi:acetyltransferase-like isoleucine patch superfamily enzyme
MVARNCTTIGLPNITLGDRVRIEGFTSIIAAGGTVRIGSHVHIATACMLGARGGIEIGDFASLSQGARIFTAIDDFSGRRLSNATVPADLDARAERACSRSAVMSRSVPVRSSCRGWNSASNPARSTGERSRNLLALEPTVSADGVGRPVGRSKPLSLRLSARYSAP